MPPVAVVAVAATETGGAALLPLADDGTKTGPIQTAGTADEVWPQSSRSARPPMHHDGCGPTTGAIYPDCSTRVFASVGVTTLSSPRPC